MSRPWRDRARGFCSVYEAMVPRPIRSERGHLVSPAFNIRIDGASFDRMRQGQSLAAALHLGILALALVAALSDHDEVGVALALALQAAIVTAFVADWRWSRERGSRDSE